MIKKTILVGVITASVSGGVVGADGPVAVPITAKWSGFVQYDASVAGGNGITSDSLYGLRSVRTDLKGTLADAVTYRIHVDYSGGTVKLLDGHADLPVARGWQLRVGKFKAPIGIELLQAPTDTTFIDYGYSTYFTPNRDTGIMLYGKPYGWETQIAVMTGTTDYGSADKDSDTHRSLDVRTIGKPFGSEFGWLNSLELGVAGSVERRIGSSSTSQLSTYKPSGRSALFTYASGVFANGDFYRIAPQFTVYSGPIGIIGEVVVSGQDVGKAALANTTLVHTAWQFQTQYYLTGETASYKYVSPRDSFNPDQNHWGAVQLVARVEQARFDHNSFVNFASGIETSTGLTVGINWIWSPSTKWFFNAENVWNTAASGQETSVAYLDARVQVQF